VEVGDKVWFWRHGFLFFKSKKSRRWSDLNSGVGALEIFCGFMAPGTCLYCVLTNQKGYYKLLGYFKVKKKIGILNNIPHFLFFLLMRFSDNQKESNNCINCSINCIQILLDSTKKKILHFNSFPKKLNWSLTQREKKFSKYSFYSLTEP
jgi:hypothetical protein